MLSMKVSSVARVSRVFRSVAIVLGCAACVFASVPALAQSAPPSDAVEDSWPRVIKSDAATLTVYPPSFQSWTGTELKGTCALAIANADGKSQTFGVLAFTANTEVNKLNRVVTLTGIQVSSVSVPENAALQASISAEIASKSQGRVLHVSLDRLEAAVPGMASAPAAPAVQLENTPPAITVSPTPTVLVPIQGQPVLRPMDGTSFSRVINTPMLVLKDTRGSFWLKIADGWMTAPALAGPWAVARTNDPALASVVQWAQSQPSINLLAPSSADSAQAASLTKSAPIILVSTGAAEVLVTDGAPQWQDAGDSGVQFVSNTSANMFRLKSNSAIYILVSGRWFTAAALGGPWTFVAASDLPGAFAKIPNDSPKENVLASVPGTPQSSESLIANTIPQMTRVPLTQQLPLPAVSGGAPVWRAIPGTRLQVLANCATPVFQAIDGSCYAVQNGVWFTASQFNAPWAVATAVPSDIYTIPPSSPYYYVTFVRVYSATDSDVLVGYTPGYFGSYVQGGVVVYGTGYYYAPYYDTVWVPVPVTYGCGAAVCYSPWAGWCYGFGAGMAAGWALAGDNWVCGPYPYWGPYYGAYGAHGAYAWGPGGWAATTGNVYHQWGNNVSGMTRTSAGYNAWTGNAWSTRTATAYNSATGAAAAGQRGYVQNAYTGNWAEGARGAGYNPTTGNYASGKVGAVGNGDRTDAVGGKATVGNTETGNSATVAGVKTDNGSWGVAHGEDGTAVEHNGNVYGMQDGKTYAYDGDSNSWQRYEEGNWKPVNDADTTRALDRQAAQRQDGDWRAQNTGRWQSGGEGFSGERANNASRGNWSRGYSGGGNAGRAGRAGGGGRR